MSLDETISTLKVAKRAKSIKNKPKVNLKHSEAYYLNIIA